MTQSLAHDIALGWYQELSGLTQDYVGYRWTGIWLVLSSHMTLAVPDISSVVRAAVYEAGLDMK